MNEKIKFNRLFEYFSLVLWLLIPLMVGSATGSDSNPTSTIAGIVLDEATQQPLIGANVMIVDTHLGDATDLEGRFEITGIAVGTRHLQVNMIGYEKRVFLNLMVTAARPLDLVIELKMESLEGEAIEVTGKAFTRSSASVLSTLHVDNFEIRSDPGGAYDIQRVVQSLPSVTTAIDQENEIITRGGMPGENLFLLDNIEIPNPNHFGFEGAGGGPINMINPLFVREIEFTPGAFPRGMATRRAASWTSDCGKDRGSGSRLILICPWRERESTVRDPSLAEKGHF